MKRKTKTMRRLRRIFFGDEEEEEAGYDVEAQTLLALLVRLRTLRQAAMMGGGLAGGLGEPSGMAPEMHEVPATAFSNPFSVRRDSVKFQRPEASSPEPTVEVVFDSTSACTVSVEAPSPSPPVPYPPGIGHRHVAHVPASATRIAVVLSAEEQSTSIARSERTEIDLSAAKASVVLQSVVLADGSAMTFEEFFSGERCVICFSDTTDVAVLPCKHLSLCHECAELLRLNTPTCPVCRSEIGAMVHIGEAAPPAGSSSSARPSLEAPRSQQQGAGTVAAVP